MDGCPEETVILSMDIAVVPSVCSRMKGILWVFQNQTSTFRNMYSWDIQLSVINSVFDLEQNT